MSNLGNERISSPVPTYFYVGRAAPETSGRVHAFYAGILVLAKLCSSFSIFLLANFINTKLSHTVPWIGNGRVVRMGILADFSAIVQILTFIQFGSGLLFLIILNVLKQNTLPKFGLKDICSCRDVYWIRLVVYSFCSTILLFLRFGGIQLCGPFRTVFVGTYYDMTLATLASVCLFRSRLKPHLYGVALFALGVFLEYAFDDSHLDHADEPWHRVTNYIGLSMLLFSAFLKYGFTGIGFTTSLVKDSGGVIPLHSASTVISGSVLLVLSLVHLMTGGDLIFFHLLPVSFIIIFGFVIDFYVDEVVVKRMDPTLATRIGTTASFFSAFIFVLVLSQIGTASAPGLFSLLAFGIIYVATFFLTTGTGAVDRSGFVYSSLGDGLPHVFKSSDQMIRPASQTDLTNPNGKSAHSAVLIA